MKKSRLKSHSVGRRKLLRRTTLKAWFTAQPSKCSYRLRGRDLSHRSRQAACSRELETLWSVSVSKANTWLNCNQSLFTASCNSYSPPGTLHSDCGPFIWCRTRFLYILHTLHVSCVYHFDSFPPWERILLACRLHSLQQQISCMQIKKLRGR